MKLFFLLLDYLSLTKNLNQTTEKSKDHYHGKHLKETPFPKRDEL